MSRQRGIGALMKSANGALRHPARIDAGTPIRVGVDLGTAFTVIMVTDDAGKPLAAAHAFADVVRDGVVWDFAGAQAVVRDLKDRLESATGRELLHAAVTIPPGVLEADHRAHRYVVEGAGMECAAVVDETTSANRILGIRDGAVVDIGGGTTGVAILRDGEVIANIDEPTGGTHLSLVISGALKVSFAEAEKRKMRTSQHPEPLPPRATDPREGRHHRLRGHQGARCPRDSPGRRHRRLHRRCGCDDRDHGGPRDGRPPPHARDPARRGRMVATNPLEGRSLT